MELEDKYYKLHKEIGDKFNLSPEAVKSMRGSFFNGGRKTILEMANYTQDTLCKIYQPTSKRKTYHLEILPFLAKCTEEEFKEIFKNTIKLSD
jgi:hypothetical protein